MTIRRKAITLCRTARGQRQALSARRSVSPPRRLTAAETERYTAATIRGGCAIQTIGMPGGRSLLLAGVVVALAAITGAAWLRETRPRSVVQPAAQTVSTRAEKPPPTALTADEERFATALWVRSEEHTSELQSHLNLVCRLLLEKKKAQDMR